jgi:hypothetical protein
MRTVPAGAEAPPLIARKSRRIDNTMALVTVKKLGFEARGWKLADECEFRVKSNRSQVFSG